MRHANCRKAIADGNITDGVEKHLAFCPECSAFARRVNALTTSAAHLLNVPAPEGLADRVIQHVRREHALGAAPAMVAVPAASAGDGWAASPSLSNLFRRRLASAVAVAAAVALVATVAVWPRAGVDDGRGLSNALLIAAKKTAATDTARFQVTGRSMIDVALPRIIFKVPKVAPRLRPRAPMLPVAPRSDMQAPADRPRGTQGGYWARVEAELDRAARELDRTEEELARAEEELDSVAEELERVEQELGRIDRELSASFGGSIRFGPGVVDPVVPRQLETTVEFTATGEVVRPDRLHLEGRVHQPSGESGRGFELTVVADDTYLRGGGRYWLRIPAPSGPFATLLLDADGAIDLLKKARDERLLGAETIAGKQLRHYRFTLPEDVVPNLQHVRGMSLVADAWIDDADLLRKLTLKVSGSLVTDERFGVEWRTSTTIRLFDFGADVAIEPPPAKLVRGEMTHPFGASALAYPFHARLSSSFSALDDFLDLVFGEAR